MEKLKRIFPLMMIYIAIVCLNIFVFAYLYHQNHSIVDPSSYQEGMEFHRVSKTDILYFSGITYLTIGYGDFKTANGIGQFLAVIQGFSGVLINSIFTGMFLYYLVKRPKNIHLTNDIYIRYKEKQKRFFLSIRVGNKGRPVVNVNRILEIFIYHNDIKKRKFQFSQEYHYLDHYLYWEIDLHKKENSKLLSYLRDALTNKIKISIRISILGTDANAGELVFTSRDYKNHHLHFIENYYDLYKWKNNCRSKINWRNFNLVYKLSKEKIEEFYNYDR